MADSAFLSQLRADIQAQIPNVTFTSSPTDDLTPAYLNTVDAVVLGVASGDFSAIAPLTAAEQTALLSYAQSGGTVLIFADNSSFNGNAPEANASLLSPFNLAVDGTLSGSQTASFLTGTGTLDTYFPTDFTALDGSTELAKYDSDGSPAATWFPQGTLSSGSGPVFAFGDSSMMLNSYITANDAAAIVTALKLAGTGSTQTAPEPATWTLLAAGMGLAAGLKKLA